LIAEEEWGKSAAWYPSDVMVHGRDVVDMEAERLYVIRPCENF
jgi:hypothetical protein